MQQFSSCFDDSLLSLAIVNLRAAQKCVVFLLCSNYCKHVRHSMHQWLFLPLLLFTLLLIPVCGMEIFFLFIIGFFYWLKVTRVYIKKSIFVSSYIWTKFCSALSPLPSVKLFQYLTLSLVFNILVVLFTFNLSPAHVLFQPCVSCLCYTFSYRLVQSTASSGEDDKSQLSMRPQTPQGEVREGSELDGQVTWRKATPLPTPEEKMRQAAKAVPTDIVAINVTGTERLLTTAVVVSWRPFE